MKITAIKRFNHHAPGDTWDADDKDGKLWIKEGLAEKAVDAPPADKEKKAPEVKK